MKRLLSVLCITALLLGSITGCGKEEVTLEQPYDIYETTGSLGLGTTVSAGAQEYFSKDLFDLVQIQRIHRLQKAPVLLIWQQMRLSMQKIYMRDYIRQVQQKF